jgi:uncharacterized protein (DUF433 family)
MDITNKFTARETAFLLDGELSTLRKEFEEYGVINTVIDDATGARSVDWQSVLFFRILKEYKDLLTRKGRLALFSAIASGEVEKAAIGKSLFESVSPIKNELDSRLKELVHINASVHLHDGVPFIKGTDIDAYRVAALAKTSFDEAIFDYPNITKNQIESALLYAKVYPKPGRPYPAQSFKRSIIGDQADELLELLRIGEAQKHNRAME